MVDAAHTVGVADEYVRQWLGPQIDYDAAKNSDLLHTSATTWNAAVTTTNRLLLHLHRRTFRYRLGRIEDLTGFDLRIIEHSLQSACGFASVALTYTGSACTR